jgi:hypothetical protein
MSAEECSPAINLIVIYVLKYVGDIGKWQWLGKSGYNRYYL